MDIEKQRSSILTKLFEKFFNTDGHLFSARSKPPTYEGSTRKPLPKQPPTRPLAESTTVSPYRNWFDKWMREKFPFNLNHERTTTRPLWTGTLNYARNTKVGTPITPRSFRDRTTERTRTKVEHPLVIRSGSSFNLENCLWVALGGIGVLILMAIFMKLGRPIRRVRRQLSNNRPAPDVITVTLNPDDRHLDMGSLLRLDDIAASTDPAPRYDPPPPYIECVGSSSSINKYDIEEPPPRYSASFENFKDAEPQVHIRRQNDDDVQNDLNEDGVRVEFIANTSNSSDSDDVASVKSTELVFDKGRIVERPSLDLNSNNTVS